MELDLPKDITPEQEQEIRNNFHADQSAKMKTAPKPTPQQSHA